MYKSHRLDLFANLYGRIISFGSNLQSLFLLWMRLTWGHQFVLMASSKLSNIQDTITLFQTLHISHPEFHAYFVAYLELIGGILLAIGFASRLVCIPLAITMLIALSTAHAPDLTHFRFITDPSSLVHQPPYPYLITTLLVLCFGPGRVSIDALISRWVKRQPKY